MLNNLGLFDVFFLSMIMVGGISAIGCVVIKGFNKPKQKSGKFNPQFDMVNRVK